MPARFRSPLTKGAFTEVVIFTEEDVLKYCAKHSGDVERGSDKRAIYDRYIKRPMDLALAAGLFLTLLPLFVGIALLVKVSSPGPCLYRGVRGARGGGSFRIFKFRSMVVNAERVGGGTTALDDPRITRMGGFLRKTKLDETPQLLNIILGDMSFIGPRPELLQYTRAYQGAERLILRVRPGITDASSLMFISLDEVVGGGNADENYERLVLRRKNLLRLGYVLFQSPWLDARLFGLTVWRVSAKFVNVALKRK